MSDLLTATGISKTYKSGGGDLTVLQSSDLALKGGEIVAMVGPSGSGKSTLLHILGLLDTPSAGKLVFGGKDITNIKDKERTRIRRKHIGFIYQFHHLLPEFSALENVAMPLIIDGVKKKVAHAKAEEMLISLGLRDRVHHRPGQLSGGEQQRVAIARALVHEPAILLADELTGNLDPETSASVFNILMEQVRGRNIAALIATHNMSLADQMDRALELKAGKILPF